MLCFRGCHAPIKQRIRHPRTSQITPTNLPADRLRLELRMVNKRQFKRNTDAAQLLSGMRRCSRNPLVDRWTDSLSDMMESHLQREDDAPMADAAEALLTLNKVRQLSQCMATTRMVRASRISLLQYSFAFVAGATAPEQEPWRNRPRRFPWRHGARRGQAHPLRALSEPKLEERN